MNGRGKWVELSREAWRETVPNAPDAQHASLQLHGSGTFAELRDEARSVLRLFTESGVRLDPASDLARLIADGIDVADSWDARAPGDGMQLLRIRYLDRILQAVLPLWNADNREKYLVALSSGSLDPLSRTRSRARNILWELELWSICRERKMNASLQEPDVMLELKSGKIAIACKKVYSEVNFEKILSDGVKQIKASREIGIVAINIDDLVEAGQIVIAPDIKNFLGSVAAMNVQFINRHGELFLKYLPTGRASAAFVSCGMIGLADGQLAATRQQTIWVHPSLEHEKMKLVEEFRAALMG